MSTNIKAVHILKFRSIYFVIQIWMMEKENFKHDTSLAFVQKRDSGSLKKNSKMINTL